MGLNDGYEPKQQTRTELQQLIEDFKNRGGEISRKGGYRATAVCNVCHARRSVPVEKALHRLHCHRCKSDAVKVEW
jgi:hypothetical protein